ncbi:ankyrin repeat-containing domain protein [Mycena albidolilacea]|uniref:Ankyrin repeat-containing domain protein n=1 Tax=Mycena albidolilacea TaxID=1033008 RepID=A0AAD7F299_9AGAR|nr:ankyrin repeat-containing domain protein [Mycena albidolilacea]
MVARLLGIYAEEMVYKPTMRNSRLTALGCAARHGHIEVVHLLAPTSTTSPESSHRDYLGSALVEGVQAGNIKISEYLISAGVDVNFRHTGSALWHATSRNQLASVQLLLASGADPDLGRPLFTAARYGRLDIVQALVEGGADINFRDIAGRNVLPHTTSIELLLFFLEHGADPNDADYEGNTALHAACEQHNVYGTAFVQLLCEFGAVPDKTNDQRRTAVDLVLTNGTQEVVKILEPYVQTPALQAKIARWWESRETIEV